MTAPDPGLTDLIAAHTLRVVELNEAVRYPECNGCDWVGGLVEDHAVHLASVVEQHTNGQIAELEAELEKQKRGGRTLGKTIDRTLKDVVAAVGAEDMIDEDGDGDYAAVFEKLFELRPARDAAIARAEKAEATITRVREFADNAQGWFDSHQQGPVADAVEVLIDYLRAALEGEQQ